MFKTPQITPIQTPVVEEPVLAPVQTPVVQKPVQTSVFQTPVQTPVIQEPVQAPVPTPAQFPLLNQRQQAILQTRTTTRWNIK